MLKGGSGDAESSLMTNAGNWSTLATGRQVAHLTNYVAYYFVASGGGFHSLYPEHVGAQTNIYQAIPSPFLVQSFND